MNPGWKQVELMKHAWLLRVIYVPLSDIWVHYRSHIYYNVHHIVYVCSRLFHLGLCKYTPWCSHNDKITLSCISLNVCLWLSDVWQCINRIVILIKSLTTTIKTSKSANASSFNIQNNILAFFSVQNFTSPDDGKIPSPSNENEHTMQKQREETIRTFSKQNY